MNYSIGDIISIRGVEYTVWHIESGVYHIVDSFGNGHCGDLNWLINIQEI